MIDCKKLLGKMKRNEMIILAGLILFLACFISSKISKTCVVSGCTNKKIYGSEYCQEHTCKNRTCNDKRESAYFCKEHTCQVSGCELERNQHEEHCIKTCYVPGCERIYAGFDTYCGICHFEGCNYNRVDHYVAKYCEFHTCSAPYCYDRREPGSKYCLYDMYKNQ